MEQITSVLNLPYSARVLYNTLVDIDHIGIRYGGYRGHNIIKVTDTSRSLSIDIVGPDGKEYSWAVKEEYIEEKLTIISNKTSHLFPFKFFRSIYSIEPCNEACVLTLTKEFELETNSIYQVGQILPSLKMAAKQNKEQVEQLLSELL